jgi:hypothetical protein
VTAIVTAKAGSGQDTVPVYWTSENPRNAGDVTVEFAPAAQQDSGVLPEARTGDQWVGLVVKTTDQFGNRVGGEDVDLTDNAGDWDFDDGQVTTDYDEQADDYAWSDQAGTQNITASWSQHDDEYTPDNTNGGDVGTELDETDDHEHTDTIAIQWYDGNVSSTTVTMDDNTGGVASVGETVTERVTVLDQKGNPVQGYFVEFVRSGPNPQQGDVNYTTTTDRNGIATYNFKGDTAGTASISAVIRANDGAQGSAGTQVAQKNDTVKFGNTSTGKKNIDAKLLGKNNGRKPDFPWVNAPNAARGAQVRLFRVKANGTRVFVASKTANAYGNAIFKVADRNGRKYTKYIARVGSTPRTNVDFTNFKSIR